MSQQQKINIKKDLVVFLVKRNIVQFCSEEKPTRTVLLPECCTITILWLNICDFPHLFHPCVSLDFESDFFVLDFKIIFLLLFNNNNNNNNDRYNND